MAAIEKDVQALANSMASCLQVDMSDWIKTIEEAIDDTLTRLDEFTGVIDVLNKETNVEVALEVLAKKPDLLILFERIRKLESIVATVKDTVDSFELAVIKAENDLNYSPGGKIINVIKPLIFKKPTVNRQGQASQPTFSHPDIYSTKDLFSNHELSN